MRRVSHAALLVAGAVTAVCLLAGCGQSDENQSQGSSSTSVDVATAGQEGESTDTADGSSAKCPACLEEEAGHDASGQEHVCRVDSEAAAAAPPDTSVIDKVASAESGVPGIVEAIQISPDPAILQTIVGAQPDLDYNFVNQDGQAVNLSAYKGKTLVITSFYTSCPIDEMCPRLTADMGWLAGQIPDEMREDIRLIMISFDPSKDSPEVMKAFGRMRGVDYEVTDMLTGDVENIKAILGEELMVDIEVNPLTNAITTHAMMVQVINPDGYIVVERTANHTESIELVAQEMVRAASMPYVPSDEQQTEADENEDAASADSEG
ncbi:MAG: SCO family protein [Planctomycetes bacterium]|nr:SCO family protein [Planctomycetota bacterium]